MSHFTTRVLPAAHPRASDNRRYVERLVKFLLWQRGAFHVYVEGPRDIADHLAGCLAPAGSRAFDAGFMAEVYEQPRLRVSLVGPGEPPPEREAPLALGGHWDGCRIGFDAGGSDRKVAAVIDGKEVFTEEVVWHPKLADDPRYHVEGIEASLRAAARHLPRIDAIGVSSAGIYVGNETRVASLFRRVPPDRFRETIRTVYIDAAARLGEAPLEVANDGDVTALAGALRLGDRPVLGLALGTSLAAGYVDERGRITGWLNELAFAPVDEAPDAVADEEWSGDRGVGSSYLSQDALLRLAPRAGIALDAEAPPAVRLEQLQASMASGDSRAKLLYETVGTYLGYALLNYADFYPLKHVLVLGRVTSGEGGALLCQKARDVLEREAPSLAERVTLHLPDESSRRVGQAIAAASLPRLTKGSEA